MNACPDFDSTALPPAAATISRVFQVRRGSCTIALPGVRARNTDGEQADDVVALDEPAVLVEQEAAVVVAVPRDREIRADAA